MTNPTFICEDLTQQADSGRVILTGAEAHHLRVKRISPGESVDLVNGSGVRAPAELIRIDNGEAHLRVGPVAVEPVPRPAIVLIQALIKDGRDQQVVQMATEVGVSGIIAWQAQRSIVRWRTAKLDKALRGWQDWARESAKQSRRATIPPVRFAGSISGVITQLDDLASDLTKNSTTQNPTGHTHPTCNGQEAVEQKENASTDTANIALVVAHEDVRETLFKIGAAALAADVIGVVIGPEGGFSPEETQQWLSHGATLVSLGEHILRAATAGIVTLSAIKCLTNC